MIPARSARPPGHQLFQLQFASFLLGPFAPRCANVRPAVPDKKSRAWRTNVPHLPSSALLCPWSLDCLSSREVKRESPRTSLQKQSNAANELTPVCRFGPGAGKRADCQESAHVEEVSHEEDQPIGRV